MTGRATALDMTHPLWRLLTTISEVRDEAERARLTATAIPAVVPSTLCGVSLLTEDEDSWDLVLVRDGAQVTEGPELERTLAALTPALESAFDAPAVLIHSSGDSSLDRRHSQALAQLGVGQLAVAALKTLHHRVGAIFVARRTDAFSADEEMCLTLLAESASLGFENARLYEQLQAYADDAKRSAEQYSALYHNTPVMMHSIDDDGRLIRVNDYWLRVLGYERQDVLGRRSVEFLTEASRTIVLEEGFPQLRATGYVHDVEIAMVKKDGATVDVLSSAIAQFDDQGRIQQTMAFFVDISDRKKAEEELRRSEARFAGLFRSAMDAIVIVDVDGRITLFNEAAERVFRCSAKDARGERFTQRFASDEFCQILEDCLREPQVEEITQRYLVAAGGLKAIRADGETFTAEATISQVDIPGEPLYAIILRDVDDRKRAEAELRQLRRESDYLREEIKTQHDFDEIIGQSRSIRSVLQLVETVAPTGATVLILGETGTGKELIARATHDLSPSRDKPLVKVNCAALPAGLIESELFGHEKGAFTGAVARKTGRFELADGGTIFLDEIGDLPLDMQAKLLRVLQEGEFERVGGTRTITVDVRIIAATNRALKQAVAEERFRSDLYYRLNVFPINVPALRERKEDIPALVNYFVGKYARQLGKQIETVSESVMRALVAYPWPGNIRELENVIERAVILTAGSVLELGGWLTEAGPTPDETGVLTLDDAQRRHIIQTLELTNWQVSGERGAARLLSVKPTTLAARMKKLGIERPASPSPGNF